MTLSRRQMLHRLGLSIVAIPIAQACGGNGSAGVDAGGTDGGSDGTVNGSDWASGGTAAMTDKATYPDPFTAAAITCTLVASTTEGPCTTATDLARVDVSEGHPGIPVRIALRVVDSQCNPVAGAVVRIWHTDKTGSYSGQTPNNGMCLKDQAYASMDFMRGVQTTNSAGIVYFDTCYPGWYRGRAIHIHFQVKNGATTYRISQLFFPEAIAQGIFASHVDYKSYGQPDTTFANDNIIGAIPTGSRASLIFDVARMTDGAMLASKTVTVT